MIKIVLLFAIIFPKSFMVAGSTEDEFEKEFSMQELIPSVYCVSICNNESVETFKIIKL